MSMYFYPRLDFIREILSLVFEQKRKQSKKSVTSSSFEQKKKDTEKESAIGRWSKHRNRDQSCITSLLMQTKVK